MYLTFLLLIENHSYNNKSAASTDKTLLAFPSCYNIQATPFIYKFDVENLYYYKIFTKHE